jgi:hypothetical protein
MAPVGSVGAPRIGRTRRLDIVAGAAGERLQVIGETFSRFRCHRQGRGGGLFLIVSLTVWRLVHFHCDIDDVGQVVLGLGVGLDGHGMTLA